MDIEVYIFGEVVTPPVFKWKNYNKEQNQLITGWECDVHTTSSVTGDLKVVGVQLCFDLIKWDPVRLGDLVQLSVQHEQISKTHPTGKVLKCNVVKRR